MTDRDELRRLHATTLTANGDTYWDSLFKCTRAVPELLDSLDANDKRLADLELRLQIATETNVADRKRMVELEAGLLDAINWIQDRSAPDAIIAPRLGKLLPSWTT